MVFRLGEELTIRIPRRLAAVELVENEQRWIPMLAERLPPPIPAPVWAGRPGSNYPWKWSLCPWLPSETAALTPPTDVLDAARSLGAFLAALHVAAPSNAPVNSFRGIPLERCTDRLHTAVETLGGTIPAAIAPRGTSRRGLRRALRRRGLSRGPIVCLLTSVREEVWDA